MNSRIDMLFLGPFYGGDSDSGRKQLVDANRRCAGSESSNPSKIKVMVEGVTGIIAR